MMIVQGHASLFSLLFFFFEWRKSVKKWVSVKCVLIINGFYTLNRNDNETKVVNKVKSEDNEGFFLLSAFIGAFQSYWKCKICFSFITKHKTVYCNFWLTQPCCKQRILLFILLTPCPWLNLIELFDSIWSALRIIRIQEGMGSFFFLGKLSPFPAIHRYAAEDKKKQAKWKRISDMRCKAENTHLLNAAARIMFAVIFHRMKPKNPLFNYL